MKANVFAVIVCCAPVLLGAAPFCAAQNLPRSLGEAKALYEAAEYDNALAVLDNTAVDKESPTEARERALYRVLCLMALDRKQEAETAAAQIVQADPLFTPGADLSPRLKTLFTDTREKLLPDIVDKQYQLGKDRYDKGDYAGAAAAFDVALQLIDTAPEGAPAAIKDIRTLAVGFRDLSRQRVDSSAVRQERATTQIQAAPALAGKAQPQNASEALTIIDSVATRQDIPPPPPYVASLLRTLGQEITGVVEITINSHGDVDRARMVQGIHPMYDTLLLAAAKRWKYEAATRNGSPIESVKRIVVKVHLQ